MSGSHLSKEFFELVKAIGECRSKQEEDKIMQTEVACIKQILSDSSSRNPKRAKELLVRLLYVELLGHDASFGYIQAVNLTNDKHLVAKRSGYLACAIFLNPGHELMLLLINTMQKDMSSSNYLEVSAALTAATYLINSEMVPVMLPVITKLLQHTQEGVRKKALLAFQRCWHISPNQVPDPQRIIRKALSDSDSSVMGVALNLLAEQPIAANKDLIPPLVAILKQVIEHRLPKEYEYHRMPNPWLQLRLISLLGRLAEGDAVSSEPVYDVLQECMRRANTGVNAGNAIIFECVKCAARLYRNHTLLEHSALMVAKFIAPESHNNLRCLGVTGLAAVVGVSPQYAVEHQLAVVECLEDPDETLKRETLNLLVKMTNPANAPAIVAKLLTHLRTSPPDAFLRRELATKSALLAEQFAPSPEWYLDTVLEIATLAGPLLPDKAAWTAAKIVQENQELWKFAVKKFSNLLTSRKLSLLSETVLRATAWVLGEWGGIGELRILVDFVFPALKGDAAASVVTAVSKIQSRTSGLDQKWFVSLATKIDPPVQARAAMISAVFPGALPKSAAFEDAICAFETFSLAAGKLAVDLPAEKPAAPAAREAALRFAAYAAPQPPPLLPPAEPPQSAQLPGVVASSKWGPKGYSQHKVSAPSPILSPPAAESQAPQPSPPPVAVAPVAPSAEQLEKKKRADELFLGVVSQAPPAPVAEPATNDDLLGLSGSASSPRSAPIGETVASEDGLGFLLEPTPIKVSQYLSPLLITTADVGATWSKMTAEQTVSVTVNVAVTFDSVVSAVATKVGAFVVEVIGDEAILAGITRCELANQVFMHCSGWKGSGALTVLVVSQSQEVSEIVAQVLVQGV